MVIAKNLLYATVAWSCCVGSAYADFIVFGEKKSVTRSDDPQIVSLEFLVERMAVDGEPPLRVGNFQLFVELQGHQAGTLAKIVDAGETVGSMQAFSLEQISTTETTAFGATFNFADPFVIDDGGGLLRVDVELHPDAFGTYMLNVGTGPDETQFTSPDDFETLLSFDTRSGELTAVPEPSGCILVALLAGSLGLTRRHR